MPTFDEALELMRLSDLGYLYMLLIVWTGTAAGMYLADRRAWFASALKWTVPAAVPLAAAVLNPLAGLLAAGAALATRLKINLANPLPYIVGLAALLRIPALSSSYWFDEAFTSRLISIPTSRFWQALMVDVHPPLYYLLLKPLAFIDNPAMLRITSLVVGLWGIVLVWRLVKVLGLGDNVANVTALLWAVMPAHILYSTELRSYALLVNLVLAAMLAILQDRPKRFAIWLAAIVWLHNAGLFYAAVLGLAALGMRGRPWLKPVLIGGGIGAVWVPFALAQAQSVAASHWAYISPGAVFQPITAMTVGSRGQAGIVVVVIAALTLIALVRMHEFLLFTGRGLLLLAGIFAVPAIEVAISLAWRPTYIWRHMLPCSLLLTIPWAYLLVRWRLARLAVAPALALALAALYTSWLPDERPDYRAWLAEACDGATAAYATSINAAFIISENSDMSVTVWPGAWDNGRSIRIADIGKFGYNTGPTPPGACILQVDIPASQQQERDFLASLDASIVAKHKLGDWRVYNLWRVTKSPG